MHILINSVNVGMQYIADFAMTASGEAPEGLAGALSELDTGTDDILLVAGMLLIPALIGLALSIVVFITICKNEGSLARMQSMFRPGKHSPSEEGATFSEERSTSPEGIAALSASGQETDSETAPGAGASMKEAKCPVITATGWIAIGICVMVIVASDLLSNVFDML
jgi:hypothetical protein